MSKAMQREIKLQAQLEKLAESKDEKVAGRAVSDLTALHIAATEAESREERITPLRTEIADLKKKLAAAEESLTPVTVERDALLAEVVALREQVAKFATVEAELIDLKTNFDARILDARKELVAEAERHSWDAQRARNEMKFQLDEAREKFGQAGLQLLLDETKKIIEQYKVPEPDPASLPHGISNLYLTLWGRTPRYASVAMAFAQVTEPTPAFKEQLYKVLSVGLPISPTLIMPSVDEQLRNENAQPHYVYPKRDPVPDLAERREVLTAMAIKFNCLDEVQARVDQKHAEIIGQQRQENTASLQRQQTDLARMGYGRSEIAAPVPVSNVPLSEHGLACSCPLCGGPSPESKWDGFIPADPALPRNVFSGNPTENSDDK